MPDKTNTTHSSEETNSLLLPTKVSEDSRDEASFPEYIRKLKTLLKKLRRYRWLYFNSSDYYENIDDYCIYYPTILFGMIISALSLITASSDNKYNNILSYTSAILAIIIAGLREIQTKKQFNAKLIKFETAGIECHILIARVNHETQFPDEEPYKFVSEIENQMIKIITDLYFKPPSHLVLRYNTSESDDTASDDIVIGSKNIKKETKSRFNSDYYDYDIEDKIDSEKIYSTQKNLIKIQHDPTSNLNSNQTDRKYRGSSHNIGTRCVKPRSGLNPPNNYINLHSNSESYYRTINDNENQQPDNIQMDIMKTDNPDTIIEVDLRNNDIDNIDNKSQISVESTIY
jgi:hypothetical protein